MFELAQLIARDLDLKLLRAGVGLRVLLPEDLPRCAVSALEKGFDGKALRRVAGMERPSWAELSDLPERMLNEMKVPPLSSEQSAQMIARAISQGIIGGWVEPYEGAKFIWRLENSLGLKELLPFVGAASEYEDHPDLKRKMTELIRQTAEDYLQRKEYA